jgi:energy-coupling factor transport system ATP-binding protein
VATVEIRGLTHRYAGTASAALRHVDLVLDGGLTVLAGSSGSGKSTLLRVFNGLVPHFHGGRISGHATVAGSDVLHTPTRRLARGVSFVFQDPETQFMGGSVEREVAFALENLCVPRGEMIDRVDHALDAAGATHLRRRAVAALSGGERQRVAVAAALAMQPALLVLDEPTSQLDAAAAASLVVLARRSADEGTTVVVAEHRLEHLLGVADSLMVLDHGELDGPAPPSHLAGRLAAPPQVVRLGMSAAWLPLPLRTEEVRARLRGLRPLPAPAPRLRDAAWTLSGVSVTAAGPRGAPLLESVDVAGGVGEVIVLMGPNGGGKTTLLRVIAGLLPPLTGTVERSGERCAYLPQNPMAMLHRPTVRDELELTLRHVRSADRAVAAELLARLGLTSHAERSPRDLSSGERQRAAIAAVLCGSPAVALLDEPTRGMDGDSRAALCGVVRRLAARGTSVVLATHDPELAADVADRVLEVAFGAVRELGPPRRALSGSSPYATQLGGLLELGPVTVEEALACV